MLSEVLNDHVIVEAYDRIAKAGIGMPFDVPVSLWRWLFRNNGVVQGSDEGRVELLDAVREKDTVVPITRRSLQRHGRQRACVVPDNVGEVLKEVVPDVALLLQFGLHLK